MTRSFGAYYLGAAVRPRRTFDALLRDPRHLRLGALALLVTAGLYTLVYVGLFAGGAHPTRFVPWLALPAEEYYRYNRFLLAPSLLLSWIVAGGLVQLIGRALGGRGTFEATLAVLGFAISVASLASLAHDLPVSLLGAFGLVDAMAHEAAMNQPTPWRTVLWIAYSAYLIWFLVLFPIAVRAAQGLSRRAAIALGVGGFATYQVLFLLFNR